MIAYRRTLAAPFSGSQQAMLALLAFALLATCFSGRAGVQVVDSATAARLFALHLHGVPGEREYVYSHGTQAPFVHNHCHAPLSESPPQPGPYEIQAASSLAGAVLCTAPLEAAMSPSAALLQPEPALLAPDGRSVLPPTEPPR